MDIIKARQELLQGKTIYDMNLRVSALVRVSTDKEEQLNSSCNQANYFDDMINDVDNWTHYKTYVDEGISGTQAFNREQFMKMIEEARLGKFDLIVTKEVSRFARNTVDSIRYTQLLLSYGVAVYFVNDNINTLYPDSEFRLTLMASMAQDEVRKLSERVKFGIKRSIKDGKVGGGELFGYDKKDCSLTINEKEAEAVKLIFNLYSTGEYGFRKIGEILANKGYYTKKGNVFSDISLKKIITNPKYKGYYTANLSRVESYKTHKKVKNPKSEWIIYKDESGRIPAIVSEELWNKANDIHNSRTESYNKNVINKQFFLENRKYTSKIICYEHNSTFIRKASDKRKDNPVWQCNEYLRHGIKGCETPILYEKHLDTIFSKIINDLISNKEDLKRIILEDYKKIIEECNEAFDIDSINAKLRELETMKDRLLDLLLKKLITDDEFKSKKEKMDIEINQNKQQLLDYESQNQSLNYIEEIVDKIKAKLDSSLNIEKDIGKYFNLFVDKVFVKKINNDRKKLKLIMLLNFNSKDKEIDYFADIKNPQFIINNEKIEVKYDKDMMKKKFLLSNTKEPRICCNGTKIRKRKII